MFSPSALSYKCGADGVRVCCINATVVCVNVLLFGPITADLVVRGWLESTRGNV